MYWGITSDTTSGKILDESFDCVFKYIYITKTSKKTEDVSFCLKILSIVEFITLHHGGYRGGGEWYPPPFLHLKRILVQFLFFFGGKN